MHAAFAVPFYSSVRGFLVLASMWLWLRVVSRPTNLCDNYVYNFPALSQTGWYNGVSTRNEITFASKWSALGRTNHPAESVSLHHPHSYYLLRRASPSVCCQVAPAGTKSVHCRAKLLSSSWWEHIGAVKLINGVAKKIHHKSIKFPQLTKLLADTMNGLVRTCSLSESKLPWRIVRSHQRGSCPLPRCGPFSISLFAVLILSLCATRQPDSTANSI